MLFQRAELDAIAITRVRPNKFLGILDRLEGEVGRSDSGGERVQVGSVAPPALRRSSYQTEKPGWPEESQSPHPEKRRVWHPV